MKIMLRKKNPQKEPSATKSALPGASHSAQCSEPEFLYIANEAHYEKVISRIESVQKTLWIGTADIKDLYVKDGRNAKPSGLRTAFDR